VKSRLMPIALLAIFLSGCATPSSAPPQPAPISPALLAPCPPHLPRALVTWGDLAQDYADLAGELAECRARQRALADASAGAK